MKASADHINQFRVRKGEYGSTDELGMYGAFRFPMRESLVIQVISADGEETGWEHVSCIAFYRGQRYGWTSRTPTWEEMCKIKDLFWDEEETVMQLHPPRSQYVNAHSHCLHLWKPEGMSIPLPDPELVGPLGKAVA